MPGAKNLCALYCSLVKIAQYTAHFAAIVRRPSECARPCSQQQALPLPFRLSKAELVLVHHHVLGRHLPAGAT
jgi:hypothetical protein